MAGIEGSFFSKRRRGQLVWLAALSVCLLLVPFVFRLDGKTHADWQQFLGRFHPLAVHVPIGLLVLVPLLEIFGRRRPGLREAAGFVLGLAIFACLGAVALGYLLAYGGGESGPRVSLHLWGGIALTIVVAACWIVRGSGMAYAGMLVLVLGVLSWTAHQGGSLTHGENYLFEYLPRPMRSWPLIGSSKAKQASGGESFYIRHINPILDSNCVSCHGTSKVNGKLRLDTYEELMKGGEEGPAVVAGQPDKSLLLQRVTLPADHAKFMPAEGKPPLKTEEIALIRAWIQQGASPTIATLTGVTVQDEVEEAPLPPVDDYTPRIAEINQAATALTVRLVPVSKDPKDGLVLQTVNAGMKFGDAQLASLDKFAPFIVEAELGRTAVTDAAFDTLVKFRHLRKLHLESDAITGSGLVKLHDLKELRYLNLSETKVTAQAAAQLGAMTNLRHVYLYDTPAQPVPASPVGEAEVKKTP